MVCYIGFECWSSKTSASPSRQTPWVRWPYSCNRAGRSSSHFLISKPRPQFLEYCGQSFAKPLLGRHCEYISCLWRIQANPRRTSMQWATGALYINALCRNIESDESLGYCTTVNLSVLPSTLQGHVISVETNDDPCMIFTQSRSLDVDRGARVWAWRFGFQRNPFRTSQPSSQPRMGTKWLQFDTLPTVNRWRELHVQTSLAHTESSRALPKFSISLSDLEGSRGCCSKILKSFHVAVNQEFVWKILVQRRITLYLKRILYYFIIHKLWSCTIRSFHPDPFNARTSRRRPQTSADTVREGRWLD